MSLPGDIGDQAAAIQQRDNDIALQRALENRKPVGPAATGECLCCGAVLPDRRWCDADCRDEYLRGGRP